MVPEHLRLKNTIKYPTSLIVGGANKLGFEIADSLIKQGGYVVIVDSVTEENIARFAQFDKNVMISFLDFTSIPHLEDDIRRLDYVFYFAHESIDFRNKVSTGEFLTFSNYLDAALSLSTKFEARFLLTTSIKANQVLLSEDRYGLEFSMKSPVQAYTDMEVQRYAEGLVMEYFQKVNLNSRVIRLGELIGDGMDFGLNSAFTNLLVNAVKAEKLVLYNDGLEQEWFVHILDAAYGLIKAQFSKGSEGKIFSLSYDSTYTHLSIAYKIQELEESSKEIQFVDNEGKYPPIRISKSATNLSTIGWMPRVMFDKAVRQSLASAKIYAIENSIKDLELKVRGQEGQRKPLSTTQKLKSFLNIAQGENLTAVEPSISPIEKLISQKRMDLEDKKVRLDIATNQIKFKKRARNLSFGEKVNKSFWDFWIGFAKFFGVFKKKTPTEVGLLLAIFILTLNIFIFFGSPFLALSRNMLVISPEYTDAKKHLEASQFDKLYDDLNNIDKYIGDSLKILKRYTPLWRIAKLDKNYTQFLQLATRYQFLSEGLKDIAYAIEPYSEYLTEYKNNTQRRSGTDGYLSTTSGGLNYEPILKKITDRKAFLDNGISKANTAIDLIQSTNLGFLPGFLVDDFTKLDLSLIEIQDSLNNLSGFKYMPEILGVGTPKTYLILALDNTRLAPAGGDLSAFALVTVSNGSIAEIVVQSTEEANFNLGGVSDQLLKEANSTRFVYTNASSFRIQDLASIPNFQAFSTYSKELFEDTFDKNIDGVIALNLSALEGLIKALPKNVDANINGINFISNDILTAINSTQGGNENLSIKRSVIAQALALGIHENLNFWLLNQKQLNNSIATGLNNADVLVNFFEQDVNDLFIEENLSSNSIYSADSYVLPSIYFKDPKVVTVEKFQNVNLALETSIGFNYQLSNKLTITFPSTGLTQEISVCLPKSIAGGSLTADPLTIPQQRTTINETNLEICLVAQVISETQISISWSNTAPFVQSASSVDLKLGVGKIKGATTKLDYKITAAPGLTITSNSLSASIANNQIIFTDNLNKDLFINIGLAK